jgi:hypothetical protein
MKKTLLIFAIVLAVTGLYAFDVDTVIQRMESAGRKTLMGKNPSCGSFIVCKEVVLVQGDVNVAREQAKLNARKTIAGIFSVKVSSVATSEKTEVETVNDDGESYTSSELSKTVTRMDINQVQRGIVICKEKLAGEKLTVYCLLTEQVADATADLEKAMKKLGPDTVRTTGVGYYNNVISLAKAREMALAEAQRNAIAEVLGISMVSTSAKQSVSAESVDNDGNEMFACDDTFKAKTFSACAGFVESSRIVDEKKTESAVFITIVAKVAKDKVMEDYRSYLETMGNPGFCVRSNDAALIDVCSGFFGDLGLRMVGNIFDAAYIIDVVGQNGDDGSVVRVIVKDKVAGGQLFSVTGESDAGGTAGCLKALKSIKSALHKKLDTFIGRANADGRKVLVRLNNYDDDEYRKVAKIVKDGLEMVPGAKNVKMKKKGDTVEYTLNYVGETEDLAEFLEKHIKTDVKRRSQRPELGKVQNTLVEFDFE